MNASFKRTIPGRQSLLLVSGIGLLAGLASVAVLAQRPGVQLHSPPVGPEAEVVVAQSETGFGQAAPGDARISWFDLPPGAVSELSSHGESVWFALWNADSEQSVVYRFTPSAKELTEVAVLHGAIASMAAADGRVVAGVGRSLILVDASGIRQQLELQPVEPMRGPEASLDGTITDIAITGEQLFVARANSNVLEVVGLEPSGLQHVSRIPLPVNAPPPRFLALVDPQMLVVSAPFDFHELSAAAYFVDTATGEAVHIEGASPVSFAPLAGRVVASQADRTDLLSLSPGRHASFEESSLPLTGAQDLIAAAKNDLWMWPTRGNSIWRITEHGDLDTYALPVFVGEASGPSGAKPEEFQNVRFPPSPGSLVATSDGYIVLSAVAGQTRLGIIGP